MLNGTLLSSSVEQWQHARMVRNMAAHNYEPDYALIAEHFNSLAELMPMLMKAGRDLIELSYRELQVQPASDNFEKEFLAIFSG